MDARGAYYGLVEAQNLRGKKEKQKEEEDDEEDSDEPSGMMISILSSNLTMR
jgi:hypothetical protein